MVVHIVLHYAVQDPRIHINTAPINETATQSNCLGVFSYLYCQSLFPQYFLVDLVRTSLWLTAHGTAWLDER